MTSKPQFLRDLPGLGSKSEEQLKRLGFDNIETFMAHDPLTIYQVTAMPMVRISMPFMPLLVPNKAVTGDKSNERVRPNY